jgi:hypothetical protein
MVLDMSGNGLDLGGRTTTTLLTGNAVTVNWTGADTDDAFLLLDADAARTVGYQIQDVRGNTVTGRIMFVPGFRITPAGGNTTIVSDAWEMLRLLDASRDGTISSGDPAWLFLFLFLDANANGSIDLRDRMNPVFEAVRSISLSNVHAPRTDAFGNTVSDGTFTSTTGMSRTAAGVVLRVYANAFHRGDPNSSGTTDISDGVDIFGFLFLGAATPACRESADFNNNGEIDISDGISLLNWLFLGGPEPAAPGPATAPCGVDPDVPGSPGDLGCEAYGHCAGA